MERTPDLSIHVQVGSNELMFLAVDANGFTLGFTLDLPTSTNFISYDVDGLAPVPDLAKNI